MHTEREREREREPTTTKGPRNSVNGPKWRMNRRLGSRCMFFFCSLICHTNGCCFRTTCTPRQTNDDDDRGSRRISPWFPPPPPLFLMITNIYSASRSGPVQVLSPSGLEPVPESFRNQGPRTKTAKNRKKTVQTGYDRSCNKYHKMR
jgi:hypothetical protein